MTESQAAAVLRRIRDRVARDHGMTVSEMRSLVLRHEARDRSAGNPFAGMPTPHALNGGRECGGC